MSLRALLAVAMSAVCQPASAWSQSLLPDFQESGYFNEQVKWSRLECGIRVLINAPGTFKADRRRLVIYATPNGNTIEETLGCSPAKEMSFRFDIQHVAAQVRRLREVDNSQDVVLAVVEAPKSSWPTFCREQPNAQAIVGDLVAALTREVAADSVALTGHSGGGSFMFTCLNASDAVPDTVDRILFLDANYAYSDEKQHGEKLLAWLSGDTNRRLVVIAYDDREIVLNGKKVVGPEGGTYRASQRMRTRFSAACELAERQAGVFQHVTGMDGRIQFFIHPNPDNKILHTALVGEMNGLLHGLTLGTGLARQWGEFGGPRAYSKWIQPRPLKETLATRATIPADAPTIVLSFPARPADAMTGTQFAQHVAALSREQREAAILQAITTGNVPDFLRRLVPIQVESIDDSGTRHVATYFVMSDYLAVGSNGDFFRIPMTPNTAVQIADQCDGSLITPKISDDVFAAAQVKLDPKPLTEQRESVATFMQHHRLVAEQLRDRAPGLLIAGIKKDVVLTNRLQEKPHKVAIYGWHYPTGRPIQPLYLGHVDWYVDYSHGIRLMSEHVIVDGQRRRVSDVLNDPQLCRLLSSEGPLDPIKLRKAAGWDHQ